MKKHIVSLLLVFTMICSLLPTIAIAAGESLNVQESNEGGEKLVVVTYVVPNAVNVTSIQLNVKFDTSKLEARDINWPSIPGFGPPIGSNATETNTNGFFGCSWSVADNTMTPANLNLVTAKFAIKSGASGSADFTITDLVIADENTDDRIAESGATQTGATYTIPKSPISSVTASVETPAAGVTLGTSVDLGGATAYTGTVKWYVGETEAAEPIAKANTKYTAKITLTAKTADGESFASSLGSLTTAEGYKIKFVDTSKLELTKTFPETGSLPAASVGTAPTAKTGLKYKGTEQELVDPGTASGGTMQYSLNGTTWTDTAPKGKNAGDYTVYYMVKGDSSHSDYTPASNTVSVTIGPKGINDSTVTIDPIPNQIYDGGNELKPLPVVKDGTTELVKDTDYTVAYYYNKNAGSAALQVNGMGNYTGTKGVTFNIDRAAQTISGPDSVEVAFGTTKDLKTVYSSNMPGAVLTFAKVTTSSVPSGTTFDAATGKVTAGSSFTGSFNVTVDSAGTANYNAAPQRTITVYIKDKIPSSYATEPAPNTGLEYDGSEQKLVTEGAANGGTVKYSLNGTTWTETVPKGKNAGTYNVQYKIEGDATHKDTAPHTHTVEIGHKQVTVSGITAANKKYDGKNTATVDASGANFTGKVDGDTLTITPTGTFADADVGENKTVTLTLGTLGGADSANYKLAATGHQTEATARITPRDLTVTPNAGQSKSYGTTTDPVLAYTPTGAVASETPSFDGALSRDPGEDVGTYNITKGSLALKDSGTFKASNYNLVLDTAVVTFEITKGTYGGATPTKTVNILKNYAGVQTGTLTAANFFTTAPAEAKITNAVPNSASSSMMSTAGADASGNFTYASQTSITAASNENWIITISSKNYTDITATLTFSPVDKTDVSTQITFPNGTLTYNGAGQKYEKATTSTTAAGTPAWTYTYAPADATASLDSAGLPKTAGTYTVTAKYEDDAHIGTKSATLTVSKATPTGAPTCTKITTSGKTLADAPLAIGTIAPAGGTLTWDMPAATVVAANTAYGWTYTPADTANYKVLTGSLTPYAVSYGGGGGGGGSTPSHSVTTDKTENGSITVSPKSASMGDTVTVTVKPDKGYELDTLKVLDKDGGKVKLTEKKGKYTFTMPDSKVTVTAEFAEIKAASTFADVPADAYYAKAVEWAVKKGITNGKANGLFGSSDPCTRGQIVTFLWRTAGSPAPKGTAKVPTDVLPGSYCYDAVAWALENGVTNGTSASTFSPGSGCTRAQIVTFLYRTYQGK